MPEDIYYLRKIGRDSVWRSPDWSTQDVRRAHEEIYDPHVREGKGLSLWRVVNEVDRRTVIAIMADLGLPASRINTADYFAIPSRHLDKLGFQPEHAPDSTTSTHKRAKELHYDLHGLTENDCRKLRDHLHEHYADIHQRIKKADVKKIVRNELARFESEEARERLKKALGLTS